MYQPDYLTTDEVVPWSWGRGNQVWSMFDAAATGDVARPLDLTNGDYNYRGWRDLHPDAPHDHWAGALGRFTL